MEGNNIIAPFVVKTYQMVNDPSTDGLITWGRANNSFIVVDPLDFSQRILPAYFKHNNFSSFVRQLNTYGFRKVDPDRWEFANQYFLRGQNHLLNNIARRKHNRSSNSSSHSKIEDMDDEEIVAEIARLRQEQRVLEEEVQGMNKRLEATERRPQQMMAFLYKVVEDPELLPRMMIEKDRTMRIGEKKRRLLISSAASSSSSSSMAVSSSIKTEEEEEGTVGVISSPEGGFEIDNLYQSSPEQYNWGMVQADPLPTGRFGGKLAVSPPDECFLSGYGGAGGPLEWFADTAVAGVEASAPPSYPFSLLGGGF